MKKFTVYDCSIIELQKIQNRAGNITPIHEMENIPFEIARVFYLYDIHQNEHFLEKKIFKFIYRGS